MVRQIQQQSIDADILIVCALAAEAKPIIAHFGLQHQATEYGFKLYGASRSKKALKEVAEQSVMLLISGVGAINMAAAMMWSRQYCQAAAYINAGIVGHGSFDLGQVLLVNQVLDVDSGVTHYPAACFPWAGKRSPLRSVNTPSKEYWVDFAYDMEGSAFFNMAMRFVTIECVQALKVVSDNPRHDHEKVSKEGVVNLMSQLLRDLETLIQLMKQEDINAALDIEDILRQMMVHWHVTANQALQLKNTLQAVQVMEQNTQTLGPNWQTFNRAKDFLQSCEQWLNNIKPNLT